MRLWRVWVERLRRALLEHDRRHGGTEPPPKAQIFMARHPVVLGLLAGVPVGLWVAHGLSAFDDPVRLLQASLFGGTLGLGTWLTCRLERRRQAHYARNGGFRRTLSQPPPVMDDTVPVWYEALHWLGYWTLCVVLVRLVGQAQNPPFTWVQSAFYAGFIIVAGWAARLVKERRGRGR
ncbi:hypothetical protein F9278_19465 [Streptomyces phaeolivaceus]|uniref:Uncharacterized protein n=1 Tax=Streptomyces phaeolivaceus TaxID=2653200 RepID=A0A5P8K5F2_9ACTN|nr:hypothetical protein [Streptomyces phaeolivaceus]QFQ98032.1 hypothetical protein F9278_19465 [Streptomyces phaeolivaceus]